MKSSRWLAIFGRKESQTSGMSSAFLFLLASLIALTISMQAQSPQETATSNASNSNSSQIESVPKLIRFSSVGRDATGQLGSGSALLTFSLFSSAQDGKAVWSEEQQLVLDGQGHYTALIGKKNPQGLLDSLLSSNQGLWLEVSVNGVVQIPRTLLVSVPYALKAADADTLGGKPVSAFLLADSNGTVRQESSKAQPDASLAVDNGGVNGTVNFLTKWTSGTNIGNSQVFDDGNNVGISNTNPQDKLHVNGNIMLSGQVTHQITMSGAVTSGRLGQDANGFFFSSDTPSKSIRFLTTGSGLAEQMRIDNQGNVGIGTSNPTFKLDVNGSVRAAGGIAFGDGSTQTTAFVSGSSISGSSSNQIVSATQNGPGAGSPTAGTLPPTAIRGDATATTNSTAGVIGSSAAPLGIGVLGVNFSATGNAVGVRGISFQSADATGVWGETTATNGDAVGVFGTSTSPLGTGVFGQASASSGDAVGVFGRSFSAGGTGVWGEVTASSGSNFAIYGRVASSGTAGVFDNVTSTGNLLLGRTGGNGNPITNVFRVDVNGRGYFNGGTQLSGADFAESVEVMERATAYEPGDVIMIDVTGARRFSLANRPYSTLVAGVYSTKPGVLSTLHQIYDGALAQTEIPLAVVGIVPCKVSGENGAISAGDLLVASSTPGYAMKATNRARMTGAVIGKALQAMNTKTGKIEILVSLQ
jgi:hypothetical protein